MPAVSDYWSTHVLYNDPTMCKKKLHIFKDNVIVTTHTYDGTTLTVTSPGTYTYYFSIEDFPSIVSQ
jgi:hypothetical protein